MQQCMRLIAYEEHTVATLHELDKLRNGNAVLRNSGCPPSEQDHELQVTYH
jgi:hypothetical protein